MITCSAAPLAAPLTVRSHPLPHMPHEKSCTQPEAVEDLTKPWEFYHRKTEPEKANVAIGTLQKLWKGMKKLGLVLAPRKKEWAQVCEGYMKSLGRQAKRQKAEREHVDAIEADSSSSSSSSSSNESPND